MPNQYTGRQHRPREQVEKEWLEYREPARGEWRHGVRGRRVWRWRVKEIVERHNYPSKGAMYYDFERYGYTERRLSTRTAEGPRNPQCPGLPFLCVVCPHQPTCKDFRCGKCKKRDRCRCQLKKSKAWKKAFAKFDKKRKAKEESRKYYADLCGAAKEDNAYFDQP